MQAAVENKRHRSRDFFRFLFAIIVCLLHNRDYEVFGEKPTAFYGGYLAVEFFFILAGFLEMAHFEKIPALQANITDEKERWKAFRAYVANRVYALFPTYLFAMLLTGSIRIIIQKWKFKEMIVKGFYELFMLQTMGLGDFYINDLLWYVSALFCGSVIVAYFIIFHRQLLLNYLAPITIVIILAAQYRLFGHYPWPMVWGVLRAICEICIGCLTYQLYKVFSRRCRRSFIVATVVEVVLVLLLLYVMWGTRSSYMDFVICPFIAAFILALALGWGGLSKVFDSKVSGYLGGISYAIYACQHVFIILFREGVIPTPGNYWVQAAEFVAMIIVLAMITTPLCKRGTDMLLKKVKEKCIIPTSNG